ncbi:MAG: hypothetical protein ACK55I_06375, partial [bacterium]
VEDDAGAAAGAEGVGAVEPHGHAAGVAEVAGDDDVVEDRAGVGADAVPGEEARIPVLAGAVEARGEIGFEGHRARGHHQRMDERLAGTDADHAVDGDHAGEGRGGVGDRRHREGERGGVRGEGGG